jgi:hypothetical protein
MDVGHWSASSRLEGKRRFLTVISTPLCAAMAPPQSWPEVLV